MQASKQASKQGKVGRDDFRRFLSLFLACSFFFLRIAGGLVRYQIAWVEGLAEVYTLYLGFACVKGLFASFLPSTVCACLKKTGSFCLFSM